MLQFFNGQIKAMPPVLRAENGRHTVIRPMIYVWEREVTDYANERKFPVVCCRCPVRGDASLQRRRIKALLRRLEEGHPGIKASLLKATRNIHLAYLLDPLLHSIGLALLAAGPLEGLWTALYNSTLWRIQKFNNSVVVGGLVLGLLCFVPLVILSNALIRRYREHVLAWVRKTRLMQAFTASKFYDIYTKVSGWGWGGLS